jgi:RNA polymerase sigma-70 factor (ECF subfamily)
MSHERVFTELRPLLFTVVYEILGSAADADDVLQDTYLRWSGIAPATVAHPRAYLVQTATRQALNHLRAAQRRREDYVGSWLPEPIRTAPDVSGDVELAESVSIAMLLVLETLSPDERAAFVLHDVFGYTHREVAGMMGKTEAAVRQIAYRARDHVQARRRRFRPDPATAARVAGSFLAAARTGDLQALMDVMAPDVVEISDGGGKVSAARRPVTGRDRVARFIAGLARRETQVGHIDFATHNGLPSVLLHTGEGVSTVLMLEVGEDELVHGIYIINNPDKLQAADQPRFLTLRRD